MRSNLFLVLCILSLILLPIRIHGAPSVDFDGSGVVGFTDFVLFAQAFGSEQDLYDLDTDGRVGFTDFLIFAQAYGKRVSTVASQGLAAFPGAEGFGALTPGGRGGKVFLVTNLNDSGPGSLREACEAEGARIVVFRVSGIIELESTLRIRNPFLTLAGQTAPGSGICLKNYSCVISTHDVVVRYLRFRPGDGAQKEMDALCVTEAYNVVIDHCSTSWGIDETLSVTNSRDVTVQWCMITESLNDSYHSKGEHGYGSLINGESGGITFHHNMYAHHKSRNPRPGGKENQPGIVLDFRNNLIYNWGSQAGYNGELRLRMNYVGNYLRSGPSTRESKRGVAFSIGGTLTTIFAADNFIEGFPEKTLNNWQMIQLPQGVGGTQAEQLRGPRPFPVPSVATDPSHVALQRILDEAGAKLPVRDAVDARIVQEIETGKGRIINSQNEVGRWPGYPQKTPPADNDRDGMPDAWELAYGLEPNGDWNSRQDLDWDGYTNLEEFLNGTDPKQKE